MNHEEEWEDVTARVPMWNATSTKNEAGATVPLEATANSFIEGYFLGTNVFDNPKKPGENLTTHSMHATRIGDEAHNEGDPLPEGGAKRDFWGSGVVNSLLENEVTPGQKIRLTYLGMATSKNNRQYKNFKVQISKTVEPLNVDNGRIVDYKPTAKPVEDNSAGAPISQLRVTTHATATNEEEEDDFPF